MTPRPKLMLHHVLKTHEYHVSVSSLCTASSVLPTEYRFVHRQAPIQVVEDCGEMCNLAPCGER